MLAKLLLEVGKLDNIIGPDQCVLPTCQNKSRMSYLDPHIDSFSPNRIGLELFKIRFSTFGANLVKFGPEYCNPDICQPCPSDTSHGSDRHTRNNSYWTIFANFCNRPPNL